MHDWPASDVDAWELFIVESTAYPLEDPSGVLIPDTLEELEAPF